MANDARELQPNTTRKAQNSMMLHKLLMGCLSSIGKNKVMTPEYQIKMNVNGQPSGNVLLKIITEIARLQTPASVQMLRNNITTMADRLAEFGQDIEKFNVYVIEQIQGLAAFGQTYDNIEYHLFNAYDKCTDQVFHAYLTKIKDQHETGEVSYTYDQVMRYAVNKYHLMVQRGEWSPEKGSLDDRLLALESKTGRIPKRNQKGKKKPSGDGNQESRFAPKGGNWIHEPPKGGVDKKATIVRKTRKGEKTFYWCHRKTGGQCDPGAWRTHKPEECRSDELKAEREKKQKDEKPKGRSLKADQTIITNLKDKEEDNPKKDDDERTITSEERRIANARYDPYASEQSLSEVDEMAVWGDPDYLVRRYRQHAKEMKQAEEFHKEREKREAKNYAKKQRKEARKLMTEQEKGGNPSSKKARND
jgi:hypothetical protein